MPDSCHLPNYMLRAHIQRWYTLRGHSFDDGAAVLGPGRHGRHVDYYSLNPFAVVLHLQSMSATEVELQLCKGESTVTHVKKM